MEEAEVEAGRLPHPWLEIGVEYAIPLVEKGGAVGVKIEVVVRGARGDELAGPQRRGGTRPKSRERSHVGWMMQPVPGNSSGGRTLIGKEGDKSPSLQLARSANNGIAIIEDGCAVEGSCPT